MPPERNAAQIAADNGRPLAFGVVDEPHSGCNCGRRRKPRRTAPLLTDGLVIASRARAREPELPEATLAHALATPIAARPARYDLIMLSGGAGEAELDTRIATEFARHEHRVFQYFAQSHAQPRPAAPTFHRLTWPGETGPPARAIETLGSLRQSHAIEAAALFVPTSFDPATASEIRRRWGWRIVTSAPAPEALANVSNILLTAGGVDALGMNDRVAHLAEGTSWPERWATLDRALRSSWPRVSIVVLTWDNLAFTRLCLASVIENTEYPNYELIVVDNASTDGTVAELRRLATELPQVRVICNDHNAGFGPANNQGLAAASGDILVLLNNDTVVPRGWLTRLAHHLENPALGLLGPGTNRTCNEAQIDIEYQTYGEFQAVARAQGARHEGEHYPIRMPMMFCLAFRRDTYERLGPLDERYEVGMFEDEDYALRAKAAGLEVAWTPEVYVHHAYHASIGKLLPTGEYMRLVKLNQGRFEEKWGICWERHRPAPTQNS